MNTYSFVHQSENQKGVFIMKTCGEMKVGQVYACEHCGFEIEVKHECDCHTGSDCQPNEAHPCCEFACCGESMKLK